MYMDKSSFHGHLKIYIKTSVRSLVVRIVSILNTATQNSFRSHLNIFREMYKIHTQCSSEVFIFLVFHKHHLHRTCQVNEFRQLMITGWPYNSQWRKVIKWSSKRITQVEHKVQLLIVSNMDLNPTTTQWEKYFNCGEVCVHQVTGIRLVIALFSLHFAIKYYDFTIRPLHQEIH